jgi:hypothetical protein
MILDQILNDVPEVLGEFTSNVNPTDLYTGLFAGSAFIILIVFSIFMLLFALAFYVYNSLALQTIAQKEKSEHSWFAWIPVLNTYLLLEISGVNTYWMIAILSPIVIYPLTLIPYIGLVFLMFYIFLMMGLTALSVYIYMKLCEKRGYDKALGLLVLVPTALLVLLGILAWGKDKK